MDESSLPSMGGLVLPCWICGALAFQIVNTKNGFKEFNHYGPMCNNCLSIVGELEKDILDQENK